MKLVWQYFDLSLVKVFSWILNPLAEKLITRFHLFFFLLVVLLWENRPTQITFYYLSILCSFYPLTNRCHGFNCIRFKYQYMFLLIQHLSRAEIQCVSGQEPYTWENSGNWFSGVFIPLPSYSMFWQLWSPRPWAFDGLSRMSNHTWGKCLFPLTSPLFQWHVGGTSREERNQVNDRSMGWEGGRRKSTAFVQYFNSNRQAF